MWAAGGQHCGGTPGRWRLGRARCPRAVHTPRRARAGRSLLTSRQPGRQSGRLSDGGAGRWRRRCTGGGRASAAIRGTGGRASALARSARILAAGLLIGFAALLAAPTLAQTPELDIGANSDGTGDATGKEGDPLSLTVKTSASSTSAVTVKWRYVSGGTAETSDYSHDGGTAAQNLTFAAGETSKTVSKTTVTIVDVDVTAPSPESASVPSGGTSVTVTFDEDLDIVVQFLPSAVIDAFTVTADGVELDIDRISSSSTITLTIRLPSGTTISQNQTVKLSYDKTVAGTDALEDAAENEVASFTDFAVTNSSTVSADATLSALALADADDTAISLSPTFATATTSYTASVANGIDEITITPTVNESHATVAYLDAPTRPSRTPTRWRPASRSRWRWGRTRSR